jgi:hypothetical protein
MLLAWLERGDTQKVQSLHVMISNAVRIATKRNSKVLMVCVLPYLVQGQLNHSWGSLRLFW